MITPDSRPGDILGTSQPTGLPADVLPAVFELLPDAVTVSVAVRDVDGHAVDMRLVYMNAAARAGQPDRTAPLGGLCSELWPQMVENGTFAACMRVLDTGRCEQGAFTWTQTSTYRAADYEYQALRVEPDHLLWVLRDNSERVVRAELTAEVTAALAAADTVDDVLTILTTRIMPAVGAVVGAAVLSEPGSDCYTVRHLHDSDRATELPAPFAVDAPYPMAHTARTGQALFFADPAERALAFPQAAHFFSERHQSTAVLPLGVGDRLFGAVSFHFPVRHSFAPSERTFLGALAGQCAQAMDRARLLREFADKQAQLQALSDVSRVLATSLDPETTFANLAATAVPRLADGCLIHLLDDTGQPALAALAHRDPAQEQALRALLHEHPPRLDAEGGIGAVVRTGRYELVTDVAHTLDRLARSADHHAALRALIPAASWLAVPLKLAGSVIGAMVLIQATPAQTPFTERDIPFAQELAHRAAQAVDNARRFTEQRRVAHTLQESLLPAGLPQLPGVDLAACYHPGERGSLVGGDFYDIAPVGPGNWALTIGDVCGKGPEAAALTGLVRHTARAALHAQSSPASVLKAVNRAIIADRPTQRFCTVAHAFLDLTGTPARLCLTLGGHPYPLLRRADGTITALGTAGTLLGVLDEPRLHTTEHELHPGDLLLLYTDGATECRGPDGMFGEDGIRRSLTRTRHASAAATIDALKSDVIGYGPTPPNDDLAILALRLS
ncbi:GAF domain-containing SpoIIE family protein phosphatase [Streptomyces sp. NPDC088745]|uniref:GAF domain-containing SpoIIE family protein phosphatase n=1 Tax=Streptomyces sp. NPDC088745 TaxID=3365884 RepID=UPI00382657A2